MKKIFIIFTTVFLLAISCNNLYAEELLEDIVEDDLILEITNETEPKLTLTTPSFQIFNYSYKSLKLEWVHEDENASYYQIYRATSKSGKYTRLTTISSSEVELGTKMSYVNSKLTFNKTYYYKIRAYNKTNDVITYSKLSSIVYKKVAVSNPLVSGVSNTFLKNTISWDKVSGATGYQYIN